ncbi:MAG: esterase-like activity of phytase family protein [Oscillatoriales cyanobacterium RM1_1_9]|nr:esterase-like activity of phytase family protein [Oscillatoriales cyanobacterium RM1_1_9]
MNPTSNTAPDALDENSVQFQAVTPLRDSQGEFFPPLVNDPEGITFTGESLLISSEGDVARQIPPFIKEFSLTGTEIQYLPVPVKFLTPKENPDFGTRNNLALESLTLTPDKTFLGNYRVGQDQGRRLVGGGWPQWQA